MPVDRHLSIVATGFRAAGWLLAVPSLAALLFLLWAWFSLQGGTPPDPRYTSIQKYGIIGVLQSGAYGLGKIFETLGGLSRWLAGILAVVSVLALAFSAALVYTGRGLQQHAVWARVVAGILALACLLSSSGMVLGLPRAGAATSLLLAGAAAYSLWVLGWRFS